MTPARIRQLLHFRGDFRTPGPGRHDLRTLTVEVLARLPDDVARWVLEETDHLFLGGHGQPGAMFRLPGTPTAAAWPGLADVIHGHEANCGRSLAGPTLPPIEGPVLTRELLTAAPERNGVGDG